MSTSTVTEEEARTIADRWGRVADSKPLIAFAESGLIADRKRFLEAIDEVCFFLKSPDDLNKLRSYANNPSPCETAARAQGWIVEDGKIHHMHDIDRRISYRTWAECCEHEDIVA